MIDKTISDLISKEVENLEADLNICLSQRGESLEGRLSTLHRLREHLDNFFRDHPDINNAILDRFRPQDESLFGSRLFKVVAPVVLKCVKDFDDEDLVNLVLHLIYNQVGEGEDDEARQVYEMIAEELAIHFDDNAYYTEEHLLDFGNFLLSKKRKDRFKNHPELGKRDLKERLSQVHDADVESWKEQW